MKTAAFAKGISVNHSVRRARIRLLGCYLALSIPVSGKAQALEPSPAMAKALAEIPKGVEADGHARDCLESAITFERLSTKERRSEGWDKAQACLPLFAKSQRVHLEWVRLYSVAERGEDVRWTRFRECWITLERHAAGATLQLSEAIRTRSYASWKNAANDFNRSVVRQQERCAAMLAQ